MCDCKECDCQSGDSGFVFGIVIGAVIGAAVAILIYRNNKSEVITNLKIKLEKYFKKFTDTKPTPEVVKPKTRVSPAKIPVVIPSKLIAKTVPPKVVSAKPRKFVKPKV